MFLRFKLRRRRGFQYIFASLLVLLVLFHHNVEGQSNKVSSKLDFDDNEDKSNSSVPIVPGVGQGSSDGGVRRGNDSGKRGKTNENSEGSDDEAEQRNRGAKTGPKIHGVRVTVDTGDDKNSKESKESFEITDSSKHRKRVGIHTDITFEITADGVDVLNKTSSDQRDDKEDDSVPIFRGRNNQGSAHRAGKPYNPRTHWNPNFSAERRHGYDNSGQGGSNYYPEYVYNVPVYTGSGDASRSAGGSVYRSADGWDSYVPGTTYWTTERSYNEYYRPNSVPNKRSDSWKPCYCITADNRHRRENTQESNGQKTRIRPSSPDLQIVNGKVEQPFSKK